MMNEEPEAHEAADDSAFSVEDAVSAYSKAQPENAADQGQADEDEPDEDGEAEDDLDDVEGEAAEEDDADEEESDDEPVAAGRFAADNANVRLDDGRIVSIADLKKGTLLHADYTRKTQEVADLRRSNEVQSERVKQMEADFKGKLDQVDSFLTAMKPQPPDPAMLADDPFAYMQAEARYRQIAQWVDYVQQQRTQANEASQAEAAKDAEAKRVKFADDMKKAMPELQDQKRVHAFVSEINQHLPSYGFAQQEIETLPPDARYFQVIRDAIRWRKLQAPKTAPKQKAEPTVPAPPVQRGGKRLSSGVQKARQATTAMERLNKSGSLDDAVAAYLANHKKG